MSDPPSRRDYARLWIEIMRRQLRGEHPDGTPVTDPPPVEEGQLADDTTTEEPLF